jgi:hypothetical protein
MERQALRRFSAPCRPDAIPAGKPVRRSEPSLCTWSLYSPLNRREGGPADYLDAYQEAIVRFCELGEAVLFRRGTSGQNRSHRQRSFRASEQLQELAVPFVIVPSTGAVYRHCPHYARLVAMTIIMKACSEADRSLVFRIEFVRCRLVGDQPLNVVLFCFYFLTYPG